MNAEENVISLYKQGASTKVIEKQGVCSSAKARKILITEGLYESPRTAEVSKLVNSGLTTTQIAERLGIGVKAVNAYLPYKKGIYNSDTPTENAVRIRKHRSN